MSNNLMLLANASAMSYYDYGYVDPYSGLYGLMSVIAGILAFAVGILVISGLISIIGMWLIFRKAGEAGWKSLIPVYNVWVFGKVIYGHGKEWLALIPLIIIVGTPIVSGIPVIGWLISLVMFIVSLIYQFTILIPSVCHAFGKYGFGSYLVYFLFSPLVLIYYGASQSVRYMGPTRVNMNGQFGNGQYGQYGNGQYGNGQYGNGQYGQFNNGQFGGQPNQYGQYNNGQFGGQYAGQPNQYGNSQSNGYGYQGNGQTGQSNGQNGQSNGQGNGQYVNNGYPNFGNGYPTGNPTNPSNDK